MVYDDSPWSAAKSEPGIDTGDFLVDEGDLLFEVVDRAVREALGAAARRDRRRLGIKFRDSVDKSVTIALQLRFSVL